jgi:homoserine kinase type II
MPFKTDLSPDELRRALAPFDLRPLHVAPVEKGTVNSNFRVDTDGGAVFLRVNEGKRESDVRYEGALLWHLGARRFPTPQPLRTATGEPYSAVAIGGARRFVTVFPWTAGRELGDDEFDQPHAAALGEALARLHLAAADFPGRRAGIYTFERIVERVDGFRSRAADLPEIASVLPILDEEIAFLRRARRAEPSVAQPPSGTIHGDLFPDNVLWQGDALAAVLDFEQASLGRYIYDLAVTLLAWCWRRPSEDRGAIVESLAWALCAGYQRVRPLDLGERDLLWAEARLAAFRFTVTRITDVYLPSLGAAAPSPRPGKDFRDYLARLLHLREAGPSAVDALVEDRPPLRAV